MQGSYTDPGVPQKSNAIATEEKQQSRYQNAAPFFCGQYLIIIVVILLL